MLGVQDGDEGVESAAGHRWSSEQRPLSSSSRGPAALQPVVAVAQLCLCTARQRQPPALVTDRAAASAWVQQQQQEEKV